MRTLSLSLLLLLACTGGDADDTGGATSTTNAPSTTTTTGASDPTTGEPTTDAPATTTSTATSTTGPADPTTTTSGDDSTTSEPLEPPGIHYVGRHDASDPNNIRMSWSGVGAVVRFDGTDLHADLDDNGRWFTVVVDGQVQPPLMTAPGPMTYPLATGLAPGEHTVELYRRTEGSFGVTTILGFDVTGELLSPPPVTRRIQVIGDSISCGYGNEGVSPCNFSAETENHYRTYGAIAARAVGAELHTIAWSGKGVVNNYGDDVFEPMPQIYDRTIAGDGGAQWDHAAWQPDVVVINLGTNDFSTDDDPPEDVFVPAYVAFLSHLRDVYPDAFILPVAPLLWGDEATMVAGYLQSVVDQRHAEGDLDVAFVDINAAPVGSGCDGHPSVATHEGMAQNLVTALGQHLGW
ncbi:SGNH/GDSL hydrolase family protein [Nannocystis pusilla]|uniref:GDSL-type esterase/lipase family protein n=1 Tax=Nannocystis pusilla TaxID=889268 RepID=A0ABS7TTG5_9BACT|nr:SGNH/GDSL hydrolase family protein [Nannocystis pusilla]MBZ5711346.1 GDSL-type esterase/lipase family protein [Nannocystis pusilla]